MVTAGTNAHTNATFRHAIKLPNKNTRNIPIVAEIPAQAVKIPRTEGSLQPKRKEKIEIKNKLSHTQLSLRALPYLPNLPQVRNNWRLHQTDAQPEQGKCEENNFLGRGHIQH